MGQKLKDKCANPTILFFVRYFKPFLTDLHVALYGVLRPCKVTQERCLETLVEFSKTIGQNIIHFLFLFFSLFPTFTVSLGLATIKWYVYAEK